MHIYVGEVRFGEGGGGGRDAKFLSPYAYGTMHGHRIVGILILTSCTILPVEYIILLYIPLVL